MLDAMRAALNDASLPAGRRRVALPLDEAGRVVWFRLVPVDPYTWRKYLPAGDTSGIESALARLPAVFEALPGIPRSLSELTAMLMAEPELGATVGAAVVTGLREMQLAQETAQGLAALCEGVDAIAETDGPPPALEDWVAYRYVRDPEDEAAPAAPTVESPVRVHVSRLPPMMRRWLELQVRQVSGEDVQVGEA